MTWYRRVSRARVLAEVPVLLGLGVAGGCAGAVLAPLLMDAGNSEPPVLRGWVGEGVLAMRGFGLGWVTGLLAGFGLTLSARRYPKPPPPAAVARIGWASALVLTAAAVAGSLARWPTGLTLVAALAAGATTARLFLQFEARKASGSSS